MSVVGVFSKGRPSGHEAATSVAKYIPRARVPWQPSRFRRENVTLEDLTKMWGRGRYRTGPGNYNSGYSTEKTHTLEDNSIQMIPKHELEKFMPDISLGPKALVTPVSLMSARHGHRVTHDMLHSYDAYIGRLQGPAVVEHDRITPHDPNFVGLNAATLDCRGRIFRWLRRGPFFQEDHYFRRSVRAPQPTVVQGKPGPTVAAHEAPLFHKIIRLAKAGHLKAACEAYRRITTVPTVEVYRALTAACCMGKGAHLGDALAILEDGNARLFYVARDGEVLSNVMKTAVAAKHRARVMWTYNTMRGRYYENTLVRAEIEPLWQYRITMVGLEWLLDTHCGEEARTLYQFLVEHDLLQCDVYARVGLQMRDALAQGKPITAYVPSMKTGLSATQNVYTFASDVAKQVFARHCALGNASVYRPLSDPRALADDGPQALQWLSLLFADIDPEAVMRAARYQHSHDLMASNAPAYIERVVQWLELLSLAYQRTEEIPLTYLRKSKPSSASPTLAARQDKTDRNRLVRLAWAPQQRQTGNRLLPHEDGFCFFYHPNMRLVEETYPHAGNTLQSRYLATQPIQKEVQVASDFSTCLTPQENSVPSGIGPGGDQEAMSLRVLHHSVFVASNSSNNSANAAQHLPESAPESARAPVSTVTLANTSTSTARSPSTPVTAVSPDDF